MIPTPSKDDEERRGIPALDHLPRRGSAPAHNCSMAWWFSLVPVTQYHPAREVSGVGLAEKCRALSAWYIRQIYREILLFIGLLTAVGKFWPPMMPT